MKQSLPISIQIENPCHEDWNKMTQEEQGRFCGSCNKIVVDFSQMSDQQIILHLKTSSNSCGRFRSEQLNRNLVEIPRDNRSWNWHWLAATSFSAFLSLQSAFASQRPKSNLRSTAVEIYVNAGAHPEFVEFEGVVIDYKKQHPIAEAEVQILATGETVKTGQDGTFHIKILMSDFLSNDSIIITKNGYQTKDYSLKLLDISKHIQLFEMDVEGSSYSIHQCDSASVCIDVELELSKEPIYGFEVLGGFSVYAGGVQHSRSTPSEPDFIARGLYAVLDLLGVKH